MLEMNLWSVLYVGDICGKALVAEGAASPVPVLCHRKQRLQLCHILDT